MVYSKVNKKNGCTYGTLILTKLYGPNFLHNVHSYTVTQLNLGLDHDINLTPSCKAYEVIVVLLSSLFSFKHVKDQINTLKH